MSTNQQPDSEDLTKQSWFNYEDALFAAGQKDAEINIALGEIFLCTLDVKSPVDGIPVFYFFYALRVSDELSFKDRFRLCLHTGPLINHRAIRGLPDVRVYYPFDLSSTAEVL